MKRRTLNAPQIAALMAILIMGSKIIGFLRELVLANYYGAGMITDAYVMAQSIPNTLLASVISAAVVAYMPIFSKKVTLDGDAEGNKFTSQLLNFLILVTLIATVLGLLFSDQLVNIFAPGYTSDTLALTSFYLKISFFTLFFSTSVALFEAYLQYKGVFLPQIVLGYAQSICIIIVTIVSAYTSHYLLIAGLLIGFAIRGIGSLILAKKHSFKYISDWHFTDAVKESMVLAFPIFIGGSVSQINTFIDRILASGLQEGSVSALNYGNMIIGVISMFTSTIFITIVYPKLNQANASQDYERMSDLSERGINLMVLISVPFTLGAMCYANAAIQVVYERGAFDAAATFLTSAAFFYYAISLPFSAINVVITKTYFSMGDTKIAVICSVISVGCNIVLNLILVQSMAHAGLALATSIAQVVNSILLYYTFKRKYPQIQLLRSKRKILKIILFSVMSVGISYIFFTAVGDSIWMPRMVLLGFTVVLAVAIYLGLLYKAKFEELNLLKDIFKRNKIEE